MMLVTLGITETTEYTYSLLSAKNAQTSSTVGFIDNFGSKVVSILIGELIDMVLVHIQSSLIENILLQH